MQLDLLASVALLKPWIISKISKISLHQRERNGLIEDLLKGSLTKKKKVSWLYNKPLRLKINKHSAIDTLKTAASYKPVAWQHNKRSALPSAACQTLPCAGVIQMYLPGYMTAPFSALLDSFDQKHASMLPKRAVSHDLSWTHVFSRFVKEKVTLSDLAWSGRRIKPAIISD